MAQPLETTMVLTEQESGWAPELVWMFWRKQNLLPLQQFKPQANQTVAGNEENRTSLRTVSLQTEI